MCVRACAAGVWKQGFELLNTPSTMALHTLKPSLHFWWAFTIKQFEDLDYLPLFSIIKICQRALNIQFEYNYHAKKLKNKITEKKYIFVFKFLFRELTAV
jgi:nitrogen fixation-related uncharacterized protein